MVKIVFSALKGLHTLYLYERFTKMNHRISHHHHLDINGLKMQALVDEKEQKKIDGIPTKIIDLIILVH